jgi:hypothetical protein
MRRIRMALALAASASALCAAAAPAMSHEFFASRLPKPLSEAEPGKIKGIGIGETLLGKEKYNQELVFGAFHIFCAAQTAGQTINEGAVSWATSPTFVTEIKFNKCLTESSYGLFKSGTPTNFNVNPETKKSEPVKFVYHVNGFAEFGAGETESEVELGSGAASFKVGNKICKINWPAQTVPARAVVKPEEEFSNVTYSNNEVPVEAKKIKQFPTLLKNRLVISNDFTTMQWSYEEGQCVGEGGFEEGISKTEAKNGIYRGALEEELVGSNIGFR